VYYYRDTQIFAIRKGDYKAHFITQPDWDSEIVTVQNPPLLYKLNIDPSEKYNIAEKHPEVIAEMRKILEKHQATIKPVENQLEK